LHYDTTLSKVFFDDLEIAAPDLHLGVGSGMHGEQSGKIMTRFEHVLKEYNPHLVMVVGDVNSTLACALSAAVFRCKNRRYHPIIAHVEAGLRSYDWHMTEEINRRMTDALSDLLFTTEPGAQSNLLREGIDTNKIFFVGNVMIDTLLRFRKKAVQSAILQKLHLREGGYAILTMHRPSNVDEKRNLKKLLGVLSRLSEFVQIVFPVHPRTKKMLTSGGFNIDYLKSTSPLGYLDFLNLVMNASFVLTDSGGIQEETTVLNVPCLTLRENTERPITVSHGTNTIVGSDAKKILGEAKRILDGRGKKGRIPKFWDGKSAQRICKIVYNHLKIAF
jgi:UDP-N-acetylglucosamine 2-epimerase (non-hydrolysing)